MISFSTASGRYCLPEEYRGALEFFDVEAFNSASSLLDNILFGKVAYGQARGAERVRDIVAQVIDALDLRAAVMEVGLSYHVGIAGGRLTGAQRQKLGIARAVLKRPDILVLNEATASLDGATQNALVDNLLKEFEGRGLVWAVHRPSMARRFDRAIVFRSGKAVENDAVGSLDRPGTALQDLIESE